MSSLFTSLIYILALYPAVVQEIRDEIQKSGMKSWSHRDVSALRYCHRVVKETLRLFPPAPFFPRAVKEDIALPHSGYIVPKGCDVWLPIHAIHHHPQHFPHPERFDPQRWTSRPCPNAAKAGPDPEGSWLPFTTGERDCIGRSIAMTEAKAFVAMLATDYDFTLMPAQSFEMEGNRVLRFASLRVFVSIREGNEDRFK